MAPINGSVPCPVSPDRTHYRAEVEPEQARFTRNQVSRAVNDGADLVMDELELGERDRDLVNLVVNAALSVLDDPSVDLDAVIQDCYQERPKTVRSWWSNWS